MRADVVVSLLKVRECRTCSQQYKAPVPIWLSLLLMLIGLAMMGWFGWRVKEVGFDRVKLLSPIAPLILAALGLFTIFYGLFKLIFQRGIRPPERQDWRERKQPLPPAAPAGAAFVAISPNAKMTGVTPLESVATPAPAPRPAPMPAPAATATATQAPPRPIVHAPDRHAHRPTVMHTSAGPMPTGPVLAALRRGTVIPAHPLAVSARRELDERRMRALTRYYLDAGAGGLAVGVHTTQFAIRKPKFNLLRPVLELVIRELHHHEEKTGKPLVKVAGVCGTTHPAIAEAELAASLGYDMGLLNLNALPHDASEFELVEHCKRVAKVFPIFGFYLQPAVGGRVLSFNFWRVFAEIPNVVAIKIAAFNRYQTIDVLRAVAEAGRALGPGVENPIAIYTGNDDFIAGDLMGEWSFDVNGTQVAQRIVGGLLGHWACWTRAAVETFESIKRVNESGVIPLEAALLGRQITDMNAAIFDAANGFKGCLSGINEVLHRQGLLEGCWCLEPGEVLSPGQADEITRVTRAYPHLTDDAFVEQHRDEWLR